MGTFDTIVKNGDLDKTCINDRWFDMNSLAVIFSQRLGNLII